MLILYDVLSESFLHLLLWLIFRQSHLNFINVRTAYASKIWTQLTKNLLTKSSTKRFQEYIRGQRRKEIECKAIGQTTASDCHSTDRNYFLYVHSYISCTRRSGADKICCEWYDSIGKRIKRGKRKTRIK